MARLRKTAAPVAREQLSRAATEFGNRAHYPGPSGMLVPERPFTAELRQALGKILRRAHPRLDVGAIAAVISKLREADDVVTVARAGPDSVADGILLDQLAATSQRLRAALLATMEKALLDAAKARLGYADTVDQRIIDGLDILAALTDAARPRLRNPKGGRPRGGAARVSGVPAFVPGWFAARAATILREHGVRPSQHQDGVLADLLRALWPPVMGVELPGDIRRLLRDACAAD